MSTRLQNEKKFVHWDELPGGKRRYWLDVIGRLGWRARYLKEVDADETTCGSRRKFTTPPANGLKPMRNSRWIKATKKRRMYL